MSDDQDRQKTLGDIAPKLAQVTDDVLFGDVWERPRLSQRDRSLITCARSAAAAAIAASSRSSAWSTADEVDRGGDRGALEVLSPRSTRSTTRSRSLGRVR
jgi:hypothetical protein